MADQKEDRREDRAIDDQADQLGAVATDPVKNPAELARTRLLWIALAVVIVLLVAWWALT